MSNDTDIQRVKTVEFAPIGIWKLDWTLTVLEANQAVCSQQGLARNLIVGRNVLDLLSYLPRELFRSVQTTMETVNHRVLSTQTAESLMPTYWEITIGPVLEGKNIAGFVMTTMEVTEREHLLRQREDFIAALSHNLKTPLVGADRTLGSLIGGVLGELNEDQSQVLQSLRRSNLHLLGMVQDLIEVYRYETNSANLSLEVVDLPALLHSCVDAARYEWQGKDIKVAWRIGNLPLVSVDRLAVKRLVNNLLEMVLKFTSEGGALTMDAVVSEKFVTLTLQADGLVLDNQDADRLFHRFCSGEPGKGYSMPAGLGLYLCRQIATAHGGDIWISHRTTSATTFSVKVPRRR